MKTHITLTRQITYIIGGQITLLASFVGGADPETGQPVTKGASIAVSQPAGKWDDAQVLAEVQKKYPDATVAWAKNAAEEAPGVPV